MIQSVERALELLNTVSRAEEGLGLKQIADAVGIKAQTANTLLKTLVEKNYLIFDSEQRKYSLGFEPLLLSERLGDSFLIHRLKTQVAEILYPFVDKIGDQLTLCVLERERFTVLQTSSGEEGHSLQIRNIDRAHDFATGSLLLAHRDESFMQKYLDQHSDVNLDLKSLKNADHFRLQRENGRVALALPIFNANHEVHMSLGCYFNSTHRPADTEKIIHEELALTADKLSELIAY